LSNFSIRLPITFSLLLQADLSSLTLFYIAFAVSSVLFFIQQLISPIVYLFQIATVATNALFH
jgi:hypothetical protein